MALFKKESCCLCGGKTGMLDKKCLDGKVCKDCKKKLSVWFEDYKTADKSMLERQLAARAADLEEAKTCCFNKVFGEFGVILIDEERRKFIAFPDTNSGMFGNQRTVNGLEDVIDLGPDLIDFDAVEDFEIDITQTSREEKQTVNGQQVSYDPQHILYMFTFTLRIKLKHPYIKSMYIQLNDGTVQIHNLGRRLWTDPGRRLAAHLLGLPGFIKENREKIYNNASLFRTLMNSPYDMPDYSYGFKCTLRNWDEIKKYQYYLLMAQEIQTILTGKRGS